MIEKKKDCLYCGKPLNAVTAKKRFCGDKCRIYYGRENERSEPAKKTAAKKAATSVKPVPPPPKAAPKKAAPKKSTGLPLPKDFLKTKKIEAVDKSGKKVPMPSPNHRAELKSPVPAVKQPVSQRQALQQTIDRLQDEVDSPPTGMDRFDLADYKNTRKKRIFELKEQLKHTN